MSGACCGLLALHVIYILKSLETSTMLLLPPLTPLPLPNCDDYEAPLSAILLFPTPKPSTTR